MIDTKKHVDIKHNLLKFYEQPVAKVSLELFLSLIAVLFFAIFAIRPTMVTMSDLLKEIEDKERIDEQLGRKVAALSSVQSEYIQLQDRLILLNEMIPSHPQVMYSLKVIEKLASDQDLLITSISVPEIPDETPIDLSAITLEQVTRTDLPVSISVSGKYPQIRSFIESMLDYRRSFIVDTIVFHTQELQGNNDLETSITITMPYFSDNKKL